MIFDIIEEKLRVNLALVTGESLFRQFMPAECNIGVMSRIPLSGIPRNPSIPDWYRGSIQIITRHSDPVAGAALSAAVSKTLEVTSPENYPASAERGVAGISLMFPKTLPIFFPQLSGNGYEWSQHFELAFYFKALV